ncbi:uncharacterized protein B0H64DRAFT_412707 [Chaetomium fimeti]|uniref:Uncharacterized protein n=1 Tax=Chaetomium fimeti TaxID=1854472 RepID=A0AAE0H5Z8_9PEZI|nr:hypothetical protein B0H64DRAFT_412707 [Chaetomium fimeti]
MEGSLNSCSSGPDAVTWCSSDTLTADPDIAGIGVISSFIASSCLAIISTCLYLVLIRSGLLPDGSFDPAAWQARNFPPNETFNPIDRWVRQHICTPFVRSILKRKWIDHARLNKLRRALFAFVLSLADMQLVAGIAMLTAAVIKLHHDSISVYHFSMVTNLAWFSSNVHLLALLAIRTELIGSLKIGRRWLPPPQKDMSVWGRARSAFSWGGDIMARVICMLTLAALLLYCSYVSGADGWNDNYHCPAACAKGREKGGEPLAWMVVNFALVLLTYPERCLALWPAVGAWWIDRARHRIVDNKGLAKPDRDREIRPWRKVFAWFWYVGSSETISIAVDGFLWFALGVYWTFDDRNSVHNEWKDYTDIGKENDVEGFGQLVPLLLLGLPFLQVLEMYSGQSRQVQREEQEENELRALARTRLNIRKMRQKHKRNATRPGCPPNYRLVHRHRARMIAR